MKEILEPLRQEGLLFKRFEPFSLKVVGSRKRITVYYGVDEQNRYTLVFIVKKKSRILQKEVQEWMELKRRIESYYGYAIRHNIALIDAPICSKAKARLEEEGWRVLIR